MRQLKSLKVRNRIGEEALQLNRWYVWEEIARRSGLPCEISTITWSSIFNITPCLLPAVDIGRLHCQGDSWRASRREGRCGIGDTEKSRKG